MAYLPLNANNDEATPQAAPESEATRLYDSEPPDPADVGEHGGVAEKGSLTLAFPAPCIASDSVPPLAKRAGSSGI